MSTLSAILLALGRVCFEIGGREKNLPTKIPTVSLFTGAGGLELGASQLGFEATVCIENDPAACATLAQNVQFAKAAVICQDVQTVSGTQLLQAAGFKRGSVPLMVGGPPCQSFSKAAYWTSPGHEARRRQTRMGVFVERRRVKKMRDPLEDPRSSLLAHYTRLLRSVLPHAFVFENVASILHPTNRPVFCRFTKTCESLGYSVIVHRVNTIDFGVAQLRQRVIVIGSRTGRNVKQLSGGRFRRHCSESGAVGPVISPYRFRRFSEPQEIIVGRYASHLREVPPGHNYKALTSWGGHPQPSFVAETRFWNFLLKLDPARPSWTIAANPGPWTGPFHWDNRRLRTTELAAIQGFPPTFKFAGTYREKRRQIGNAVPPPLSAEIFAAVLNEVL